MSFLEDPAVKQTYDKCKYIVKVWEHQFTKKNKRIPSKLDIREAPVDVRHAYRKYFQLKTAALEESFLDVEGLEDEEEPTASSQTQSTPELTSDSDFLSQLQLSNDNFTEVVPDTEELQSDNPVVDENVWGNHLNKKAESTKSAESKERGPSKPVMSITKKLFCGSKFNKQKRNPRKSLSQKRNTESSFSTESTASQSEVKVSLGHFKTEEAIEALNLETESGFLGQINTDDAKQFPSHSMPISVLNQIEKPTLRKVDTGWLNRVGQSTGVSVPIPRQEIVQTKLDYDDDDIISGSDEESPPVHVAKKFRVSLFAKSKSQPTQSNAEPSKITLKENITNNIPEQSDITKPTTESQTLNFRRSTRQKKASYEEMLSGEEDPFASDNDSGDPEYTVGDPNSSKSKRFQFAEESSDESQAVPPPAKAKTRKTKKSPKQDLTTEENTHYELEYNVKPRVMAPRFGSLKNVVTQKLKEQEPKNDVKEKSSQAGAKNKRQQAKDKLEQKIASGSLNENYVTINIKKKVFARGKKGHNFSKYKKAQWKSKKKALYGPDMDMGGCDGGKLLCFNCGQEGHFAQKCKNTKGDTLLPLQAGEEEECPFPSLEEATKMASESNLSIRKPKLLSDSNVTDDALEEGDEDWEDDLDEDLLLAEVAKLEEHVKKLDVKEYMDTVKVVKPYYDLKEDGSVVETTQEVRQVLEKFGHQTFRPGQEEAVMRILSGKSTLVTLSTGSGKSLCYQLPAYLYSQREPCISLVISPLVSLMEDQVTGIPKFLKAACLHTNQTEKHRSKILEAISKGELNVLLISPEAVVAGEKRSGFGSLFRKLPPIAFACIDEAHCVSHWSHNFRPSYLLICRVLKESLGVRTILGLTATATRATCESIIQSLGIPDGLDGIISDLPLPDNLHLTVSKDAYRDRALVNLLQSDRFKDCRSIIVYCTRREECERMAGFLRTSLKSETNVESSSKKRKRLNLQAEPYHAGMSASRRRTVQNAFMSGELKVVVATVAFGMGINKSDIRAVIHFNMPNSFESYVQEVGRAGRDGLPAHCHVFLDSQGRDENELRRHIYANSLDRHVIRKLLQKIFVPCSCKEVCPKHEVAFSIEETVRALDVPEENIATLLCYLELHENKYVELLNPAYTVCKVISYGGPLQIRKSAKECPPLAMALALYPCKEGEENILEFPVVDVASAMGWDSGICKHKLKNLEWTTVNGQPKRSSLSVQFSNLGFRLLAPGNLTDEQLDKALDTIYTTVQNQETKALKKLHAVHQVLSKVAAKSYKSCLDQSESTLKQSIRDYFQSPDPLAGLETTTSVVSNEEQLVNDVRAMICMYKDNQFTGRALARIFHGIQSPNYPAVIWGRCKFWRRHLSEDFNEICRIATREIIKMRTTTIMDEETGELNCELQVAKNAETGEEEYVTYCLDQETGEKQYYTLDRIYESLQMPNPFKISRYSTHLTAIVRSPNHKSSPVRMEFITAIVFLFPTFVLFSPLLGFLALTLDVILHRWCHRKNAKLATDDAIYYKSPLHMIYKEFCATCRMEEELKKIEEIQDKRNNKRYFMQESLRRVVA